MARLKKGIDRDIQKAQQRLDGMTAINPTLDLGDGVSVVAFKAVIDLVVEMIAQYNSLLAQTDQLLNRINASIGQVKDLTTRSLDGIKFKYGADSDEYEMAGGTRKSERKKPGRKTPAVK